MASTHRRLTRANLQDRIRAESRPASLRIFAYQVPNNDRKRGGVVTTQENPVARQQAQSLVEYYGKGLPVQQGFTTEDILWALGIWSAIICLSPVIVFYIMMVA